MKERITRILLAFTMVLGAFAVSGCATKSQTGNQVEHPKNKTSKSDQSKSDRKQGKQSDSAENPPPPPPPPTY